MSGDIREAVRERYRAAATGGSSCCGGVAAAEASPCCGSGGSRSVQFGYSFEELRALPAGADLALGCGNPTAIAGINAGETVIDLGSGGGIDCFLAARRVGSGGRVIGVDMTHEMLTRARAAAEAGGFTNVEFRLGEIENLPVADATADLVISNCVINLSPDKSRVFDEVFRVLKPGGRVSISDVVLASELSPEIRANARLFSGCIAGALLEEDYLGRLRAAGLAEVVVGKSVPYAKIEHLESLAREAGVGTEAVEEIVAATRSITVRAHKPSG